jgi:hypothetical protein
MANGTNRKGETERRTCPCKKLPLCLSSFTAAEYGDLHSLKKTGRSIADRVDQFGNTPLHLAAQNDHFAAVAMLLQLDCQVDGQKSGATPLHRAAFSGAVASMRILLQHSANLFAKDTSFNDDMTPLHKTAAGGRYLAVQLLLEALRAGGNASNGRSMLSEALDAKDGRNRTPLDVAKQSNKIEQTERESVARWDQVAGGVADWGKCVQLLSAAAEGIRSQRGDQSEAQQFAVRQESNLFLVPLPLNLTRLKDGCIDCGGEDGKCLTSSWQAQFQAALGNSIGSLPTADNRRSPVFQEQETNLVSAQVKEPKLAVEKSSSDESSSGVSCPMCGKVTIALYPTTVGKLVCKTCERSIRCP